MDNATKNQLKADLSALLTKYNVTICFTCSDSSDTHGLRDDQIVIRDAQDKIVVDTNSWQLGPADLKR